MNSNNLLLKIIKENKIMLWTTSQIYFLLKTQIMNHFFKENEINDLCEEFYGQDYLKKEEYYAY
jgi:hypothetical protein